MVKVVRYERQREDEQIIQVSTVVIDCVDMVEAQHEVRRLYELEIELPEWNIRMHSLHFTNLVATVVGFARNEFILICVDDANMTQKGVVE